LIPETVSDDESCFKLEIHQLICSIAVVKNMFRLPDLRTGENIVWDSLKLWQT
jgi:hypothetical protein